MKKCNLIYVICMLVAAVLPATSLYSQDAESPAILVLADGGELPGKLHSMVPGEYIRWIRPNGKILRFTYDEVKEIKTGTVSSSVIEIQTQNKNLEQRPWYVDFSFTYVFGNKGDRFTDESGYSLGLGGGYKWSKWLSTGLYTGYLQMVNVSDESFQPIAIQLRSHPFGYHNRPYFNLNAGYGRLLVPNQWNEFVPTQIFGITGGHGGLFIQPSVGFEIATTSRLSFGIFAGYTYQEAELEWSRTIWGWGGEFVDIFTQDVNYNRYIAGISILF